MDRSWCIRREAHSSLPRFDASSDVQNDAAVHRIQAFGQTRGIEVKARGLSAGLAGGMSTSNRGDATLEASFENK